MQSRNYIALILFAVTLIYLPIVGHQLHTDDFTRISDNSTFSSDYLRSLFLDNKTDGFYRPINHLSFGITYWIFGLHPYAYGLFNFILLASTCVVLFHIIKRLTADMGLATLLVVAWLANVKVLASTIVWAVGRTSGLEMLFSSCATFMVIKAGQSGRWPPILYALVFTALALLSKEGAVVLMPLLLGLAVYYTFHSRTMKPRHIAQLGCGLAFVYTLYFLLRHTSGAMTPDAAPVYYRWQLDPIFLLRNLASYAERSLQFSIILVPLIWILAPKATDLSVAIKMRAKWAALFLMLFALTISPALPVPSRSNLYPYVPSIFITSCMVALMGYNRKLPQFGLTRRNFFLAISILVLIAVPISWIRGYNVYLRHGHTLAWANTIESKYSQHGISSVCIQNISAADTAHQKDQLEWHFLKVALKLRDIEVDVHVSNECVHPRCIVYELERRDGGFLAGDLRHAETKLGEPWAPAYGLSPAAEP